MTTMGFCVVFFSVVLVSGALGAPVSFTGKDPIDPECTLSPVVSSDPFKCARFAKTPPPAPEDQKPLLFEGDIAGVLEPGDTIADLDNKLSSLDKAASLTTGRWFNGIIVYEISPEFSADERSVIGEAMKELEDNTDAIRFFDRRDSESDYVYIYKGSGCSSYVGRQGGVQYLSLGDNCVRFGTVVHELNHAIGFWHEQSRSDRDNYVEINLNNVPQLNQHNFRKYDTSQVTLSGTGYDFDSIMHYSRYAFALDFTLWTIRPKAPWQNFVIGQRSGLSPTDIQEINAIYPLCATMWLAPDHTGQRMNYISGQIANLHANDQDKMSSVKVTYGCTLITYSRVNRWGTATTFRPTQPGYVYWSFAGKSYDNDARSIKCTCP